MTAIIMNTIDTIASGDHILLVKSHIDGIGWNEQYRERLEDFVKDIHATAKHAYPLSIFIFFYVLQNDVNSGIITYINKELLSEQWLFFVRYHRGRVGEATACRRSFIDQGIQRYLNHTTCERPKLKYTQQLSSVEGLKSYTVYME